MNLKKFILVPLLGLLLAGCDFNPAPSSSVATTTSQEPPTSAVSDGESVATSTPVSQPTTVLTKTELDTLVLYALIDFAETDLSTINNLDLALSTALDVEVSQYAYNESEEIEKLFDMHGSAKAAVAVKVKDLQGTDPQGSVIGSAAALLTAGEDTMLELDALAEVFYKEEWVYVHTDIALSGAMIDGIEELEGSEGFEDLGIPLGDSKIKINVGPPEIGDFEPLDLSDLPISDFLEVMVVIEDTSFAMVGDKKVITQAFDDETLLDLVFFFVDEIGEEMGEISPEDLYDMILAVADELADIRTLQLAFTLDANNVLVGLAVGADLSVIVPMSDDFFEDFENLDVSIWERMEIDAEFAASLSFVLNGPVTVTYPTNLVEYIELVP